MSKKEKGDRSMPHPCALDRSLFTDSPPHACRMLEVVASIIESERERLRPILGKGEYRAGGLFRRNCDMVDSMDWEDLLLRPDTIERCAAEAGVTKPEVIRMVLTYCQPQNSIAFAWMSAFYGQADTVEKKVLWPLAVEVARAAKTRTEQVSTEIRVKNAKKGGKSRNAGNAQRAEAIKSAWASGIYATRDLCAEKEWMRLGFKTEPTARRKLQGTADPDPWPAKDM